MPILEIIYVVRINTICSFLKTNPYCLVLAISMLFSGQPLTHKFSKHVTCYLFVNITFFRKGLAPHLKSLMGPWWFSQFDPIPEVSQAARRSLEVCYFSNGTHCLIVLFIYSGHVPRIKNSLFGCESLACSTI